jgi:hypothetical protein
MIKSLYPPTILPDYVVNSYLRIIICLIILTICCITILYIANLFINKLRKKCVSKVYPLENIRLSSKFIPSNTSSMVLSEK